MYGVKCTLINAFTRALLILSQINLVHTTPPEILSLKCILMLSIHRGLRSGLFPGFTGHRMMMLIIRCSHRCTNFYFKCHFAIVVTLRCILSMTVQHFWNLAAFSSFFFRYNPYTFGRHLGRGISPLQGRYLHTV
jgi:hypothetical protein